MLLLMKKLLELIMLYCFLLSGPQQSGETALMLAAKGGYTVTVKALINAGAHITLRNRVSL